MLTPVEPEPARVFLNRFDVLDFFFGWVGVVETEVTVPAKLSRETEIYVDRRRVTDVQVAVRFRGPPGDNPPIKSAVRDVRRDGLANKILVLGFNITHINYPINCRGGVTPPAVRKLDGKQGGVTPPLQYMQEMANVN